MNNSRDITTARSDAHPLAHMMQAYQLHNQQLAVGIRQESREIEATVNARQQTLRASFQQYAELQKQVAEAKAYKQVLMETHPREMAAKQNVLQTQKVAIERQAAETSREESINAAAKQALKIIRDNPNSVINAEEAIKTFREKQPGTI